MTTERAPRGRRHSWEKLEPHRARCKHEDCGLLAEKHPDPNGPSWTTVWTLPGGEPWTTERNRTPPCEPPPQHVRVVNPPPTSCGEGVGDGQVCGRPEASLYPAGRRCDEHAPWSVFHGGDGIPPELHGQYCIVGGQRIPTPDSVTWGVVDARAIASGKRRASPEQYAAARAAVDAQKARHLSGNS